MGSSEAGWSDHVARLIKLLDNFRDQWFRGTMEGLSEAGVSVTNSNFENSASLDVAKGEIPRYFPFNTVNGENVEAALAGLQMLVAIHFISWRNYISTDEIQDFTAAWTARASSEGQRWTLGTALMFTDLSAFGGGINPDAIQAVGLDVLKALASYVTNAPPLSKQAMTTFDHLNLRLLLLLTHLSVAMAFGDSATAQDVMGRIKA